MIFLFLPKSHQCRKNSQTKPASHYFEFVWQNKTKQDKKQNQTNETNKLQNSHKTKTTQTKPKRDTNTKTKPKITLKKKVKTPQNHYLKVMKHTLFYFYAQPTQRIVLWFMSVVGNVEQYPPLFLQSPQI